MEKKNSALRGRLAVLVLPEVYIIVFVAAFQEVAVVV